MKGIFTSPPKSNFLTYNTCIWDITLPPYLSLFVLIFVMSYSLVLMFLWSPIGPLLCGSTIESPLFRASELSHHRIHESISSPFISRYSPPSFIARSLSRVAHYGLQSHCPLSLLILCQSLPSHPCPLCSNKGSRPFTTRSPPFHHHHWCQSVSHSTIFSCALV